MQKTLHEGLQASDQMRTAQTMQAVRMVTMSHRLGEINGLLLQRELRAETQIYDLSNQMNSVLNAIKMLRRIKMELRQGPEGGTKTVKASSSSSTSAGLNASKPIAEETKVKDPMLSVSDAERKPARMQLRGPHDSSSTLLSTKNTAMVDTRDQGMDHITIILDSTVADQSSTKATLGSQINDAMFKLTQANDVLWTMFFVFDCR